MAFCALLVAVACGDDSPPPRTPGGQGIALPDAAAPVDAAVASDDDDVDRASKAYVDLAVSVSPELGTTIGIHTGDAELDDRTTAGFEQNVARQEKMLSDLRARFRDPSHPLRASKQKETDLAIVEHALAVAVKVERAQKPVERMPSTYTDPMNAIFLMTARDYAPASERAKNALSRIEKIPTLVALAKKNLGRPPRVWTQNGIEAAAGAKDFFAEEERPLLDALPTEKARVLSALKAATEAYADYKQFLEKTVLPRSDGDYAAGGELFDFLLKQDFFLSEGAPELLAMGRKVMDETSAQMDALAKRIDPKAKAWPDATKVAKGHHPSAQGLLPSYRTQMTRARRFLVDKDVVTLPPGDDCQVIETPPFQRSTTSAAYDAPPPFDEVTKGLFFVTPVDLTLSKARQEQMLRENDYGDQVDTVVHEAYPGHHLQLSVARRHPSLVRKATGPAIFSEGWALYAEELMSELGFYTDEERLMQLEWTLVRAARIVIDVGLHTQGMTFDQAVAILTDKVHLERELAVSEVKRYTESPTQPSSYLVGRQKIFDMRERAKKEWGASFSLKRFHDELLSHGGIAPGLAEREMF